MSSRPPNLPALRLSTESRPPNLPTLPLRADVLLSNTLFKELDEDAISEDFLREHTGVTDLREVDFVDLQVDAVGAGQRVECVGELLPNLTQLRLSQSHICTVRDLGTSLTNLRVLWLCRCSLQDLGGITALPVLEELYVSFNDVKDLDPLLTHEALQILDLEGNSIEDMSEVQSLEALCSLKELTLSLNPVRKHVSREQILQALPNLEVLDDITRDQVIENDLFVQAADSASGAFDEAMEADDEEDMPEADQDELSGVAELLQQVAQTPRLPVLAEIDAPEDAENSLAALRALRQRSVLQASPRDAVQGNLEEEPPLTARPSADDAEPVSNISWAGGYSSAVAEFRADAAKVESSSTSGQVPGEVGEEPTEQDLIVEALKRAERPEPSLYSSRTGTARSSRTEVKRPMTGFYPAQRCRTAAKGKGSFSLGSASTACASSAANTSRSIAGMGAPVEEDVGSELTAGDDGAALAGNPLAAIRRRRKAAQERGEDEHDIRDLLRRFEPGVDQKEVPQIEGASCARPATADVRINPGKLISATAAGASAAFSLPPRQKQSRGNIADCDEFSSPAKLPKPKVCGLAEVLEIS
mmetsp:Transcript_96784/g.172161  ORF Transcript_96784/g.172161 Transcript_96784/m.172161 type:complete len:588 (+) Transcript_96784:59-1822(+)